MDGNVAWICYHDGDNSSSSNAHGIGEDRKEGEDVSAVLQWVRVHRDTTTTQQPSSRINASKKKAPRTEPWSELPDDEDHDIPQCLHLTPEQLPLQTVTQRSSEIPREIDLIEHYWTHVEPTTAAGSSPEAQKAGWNHRYQSCIEHALFHLNDKSNAEGGESTDDVIVSSAAGVFAEAGKALDSCLAEFQAVAEENAVLIVKEMLLPASKRSVKCHPQYSHVFYVPGGLMMRLCIDTASGALGGDLNAQKMATRMLQSHQLAVSEAPRHLLYVPLLALVKFGGHAFLASAVPPISKTGCLYSPSQTISGDDAAAVDVPTVVSEFVAGLGAALHLKLHGVSAPSSKPGRTKMTDAALAVDAEVYAGRDRRLYLVNIARLLPTALSLSTVPSAPHKKGRSNTNGEKVNSTPTTTAPADNYCPYSSELFIHKNVDASISGVNSEMFCATLMCRVRPELLLRWPVSLNPDVAISCCSTAEDITDAVAVSDFIRGDGITAVAGMLGLAFPVELPVMPSVPCTLCGASIDNELRLVACRSVSRCCCICAQCYTSRVFEALPPPESTNQKSKEKGGGNAPKSPDCVFRETLKSVNFSDAVRCGAASRSGNSLALEPSVTSLLHANGLNLRHLPFVYFRLPTASRELVRHYLVVEMIARAAVHILDTRLRGAATSEDARAVIQKVLLALLQSRGTEAERFWSRELGPEITRRFPAIRTPFDTTCLSTVLLMERVQELSGVALTEASFNSLVASEKPFLELQSISPVVKMVDPPRCAPERAAEEAERLSAQLERMLLFWIGYAPADRDDALQPFYLTECLLLGS